MSDQYQDLLEHLHARLGHAIKQRRVWFEWLAGENPDAATDVIGKSLGQMSEHVEGMATALAKVASASGCPAASQEAWELHRENE